MKWFKHESDARNSLKLRKVRRKYGADGYAIYWFCLEAIAYEVDKDNLTFDLKDDAETIAFELTIQEKRVEEIMHYLVEVGLFESSQGVITCLKLAERLDKSMTNSPKMRAWLNSKSVMTITDDVMTESDDVKTCPELDKTRLDKTIINNKDRSSDQSDVVEKAFEFLWPEWIRNKKINGITVYGPKSKALAKFKKKFNSTYFKKHTEEDFTDAVNNILNHMCDAYEDLAKNKDSCYFSYKGMQFPKLLDQDEW